ncbi:hypothetical protein [Lysobacter soli]|nr:hypothetical protein [Lysobacter soli]MDG2517900.1 hypothetical protein [Lysobacter soli]
MSQHVHRFVLTPLAFGLLVASAHATEPDTGDRFIFEARYRFEHVDPDNALENAEAQTLRTRIG